MYMHPETYLWMVEQDRERAMAQRALERAARSGGERRPGLARGGFTSFARVLHRVGATVSLGHVGGGSRPTTHLTGEPGV